MDIDSPTPQNDLTTTTTTNPNPNAHPTSTPSQTQTQPSTSHTHTRTLTTLTLKTPPSAYAHLSLTNPTLTTTTTTTNNSTTTTTNAPDILQLRAHLTTALRQFLGDTGAAIPIDFLAVRGGEAWVRVPREDLGAFVGAVTAFAGAGEEMMSTEGEGAGMVVRVVASGDWLGSLVGKGGEGRVWGGRG
ncbi:uncharacterized protein B0H64DRAFT_457756 [Chaetomium fimeti]|uniref:Ribonucleases P/MRP subunit Pop8-like domain-containing protein n=1 Tax=Chaetomium fimeti TaxID=1854472 RepID=A0AAE0HJS5_9PEZI|nr:hypothetical protein B0H64DRAFT_457756 [Chaetomium fimeti]